jgi:hypothetical protein
MAAGLPLAPLTAPCAPGAPQPGPPRIQLSGHTSEINSVAWSPDGAELASGADDMTVRVWDAATGAALATFEGHTDHVVERGLVARRRPAGFRVGRWKRAYLGHGL